MRDAYKLREKQMHVALLIFTTECGSLSEKSVHNQPYLCRLLFLSLFLYLCGFLYLLWLNFRKLNPHRMQLHCKHTGFFIRHFIHFISSFGANDSLPSFIPLPGTIAL